MAELRAAWHEAKEQLVLLVPQRDALKARLNHVDKEIDEKDSLVRHLQDELAAARTRVERSGQDQVGPIPGTLTLTFIPLLLPPGEPSV